MSSKESAKFWHEKCQELEAKVEENTNAHNPKIGGQAYLDFTYGEQVNMGIGNRALKCKEESE